MALTVLVGGARSGKSRLAVQLAEADPAAPVVFIATGEPRDEEMAERIRRHRADRPSAWRTVEESHDLDRALDDVADRSTVIVDCLTLWVANLLERDEDDDAIVRRAQRAASVARHRDGRTIVVSNEVGLGVVPTTALGRRYADLLGRVNTVWTAAADRAAFVVAGIAVPLGNNAWLLEDGS